MKRFVILLAILLTITGINSFAQKIGGIWH